MATLKNLPTEQPKKLVDMIEYKKNTVISMAFSKSEHVDITMLSFAENENVSEEAYFGDTMYLVLEGVVFIKEKNNEVMLNEGDVYMVNAHVLHEVFGQSAFKVLQITVY